MNWILLFWHSTQSDDCAHSTINCNFCTCSIYDIDRAFFLLRFSSFNLRECVCVHIIGLDCPRSNDRVVRTREGQLLWYFDIMVAVIWCLKQSTTDGKGGRDVTIILKNFWRFFLDFWKRLSRTAWLQTDRPQKSCKNRFLSQLRHARHFWEFAHACHALLNINH